MSHRRMAFKSASMLAAGLLVAACGSAVPTVSPTANPDREPHREPGLDPARSDRGPSRGRPRPGTGRRGLRAPRLVSGNRRQRRRRDPLHERRGVGGAGPGGPLEACHAITSVGAAPLADDRRDRCEAGIGRRAAARRGADDRIHMAGGLADRPGRRPGEPRLHRLHDRPTAWDRASRFG